MRIIAKRTLRLFWQRHPTAEGALRTWHQVVQSADWLGPEQVKRQFGSASFVADNRIVFNIGGNKYRLVVEMQYQAAIAWVKFIGTHAQYDQINVENVNDY